MFALKFDKTTSCKSNHKAVGNLLIGVELSIIVVFCVTGFVKSSGVVLSGG